MFKLLVVCLAIVTIMNVVSIIVGKPTRKIAIKSAINYCFWLGAYSSLCIGVPVACFILASSDSLLTSHLYITNSVVIICLKCFAMSFEIFVAEFVIFIFYLLLIKRKEYQEWFNIVSDYRIWKYTNEESRIIMNDELKFYDAMLLNSPKLLKTILSKKKTKLENRIYWDSMSSGL